MTRKLLIIGYFGAGNAGDEAILACTLRDLRAARPDLAFVVPGEDPASLSARFAVESFPRSEMPAMLEAVEECDAVLVGGGGLLHDIWDPQDETLLTPEHWGLTYYCGIPWLAAEIGKPVMLYAVGVGPLRFPQGRALVRQLASAATVITVRDAPSAGILEDLAGEVMPRARVTADPAWTVEALAEEPRERLLSETGLKQGRWLGVAFRNWDVDGDPGRWEEEAAAALDRFAAEHGLGLAFLPFQHAATPLQDDVALARRLAERCTAAETRVVDRSSTAEELLTLVGACEIVCGMRFHSILFACAAGVPAVAIDYDAKVANLAAMTDPPIPSVPIGALDRRRLADALEMARRRGPALAESQLALARRMRDRAGENVRLALSLLEIRAGASASRRRVLDALNRIEELRRTGATAPRIGAPDAPSPRRGVVRIVAHTFFDADGGEIFFGGGERYLIELADVVRSRGYRVEVVQTARSQDWIRYYRDLRVAGLVPHGGAFELNPAIRSRMRGRADLTVYLAFYLAGADAPPGSIGISHGIYWDDPAYQGDPEEVNRRSARLFDSIDTLDAVVSVDTNTINWVRAERAPLAEKFLYVPNFVDRADFCPGESGGAGPVVLYPRRLSRERGFWLLAEIAPALLERRSGLEIHFVGKAERSEESAVRALEARFPGRVRWYFLPPERMPEAYEKADIVVIPTLSSEGTSLSCLEGQSSGKAVIATRVGGLPDLVLDGVNGLLIEPTSAALRGAIERLLDDASFRQRLGEAGRLTSERFSIERWRERWHGVLEGYLPRRSPAAVRRARRAPTVAAFVPRSRPEAEALEPVALAVARLGIDAYWAEDGAPAPRRHRRLHPVPSAESLFLSAPLVFVAGGEDPVRLPWPEAEIVRAAPGAPEAGRDALPPASDPSFPERLRNVVRRAFQRRRQEVPMEPEKTEAAPPGQEADGTRERVRSRVAEHEQALVDLRRRAIAGRVESRRIIAELDARNRAHEAEHLRAHRHLDEVRRHLDDVTADRNAAAEAAGNARRAAEQLATELDLWKSSRVWRIGHAYWNFLARLRRLTSGKARGGETVTPSPAAAPVAPSVPPVSAPAPTSLLDGFLARPEGRYDVLVLSIVDWDFRFQRPQQLATQFGRAGHRVFYLSTTVFLPPGGPPYELVAKAPNVAELRIRSPRPLDVYGGELTGDDVAALEDALGELLAAAAAGDVLVKVDIPFWTRLALRLRERHDAVVVYDCMDEWTNFPGFARDALEREAELVRAADVTVVSAQRLLEKHERDAKRAILVRNAVDVEHYAALCGPNDILGDVRHPVIGYYGALASWVDVPLIEKIARRYPQGTVVLAGGHFDVDLSPLSALPNVRLLGQRPYAEMPKLLWNFDACVIPFLVNDITDATNPVKLYEYMAGGKPVVAPALSELEPFAGVCYLARSHEEFLRGLDEALAEAPSDPRRAARRTIAAENDWSARYRAIDGAAAETRPEVTVVVVTFDGFDFTRQCLESLRRETWPRLEIVVVDNASRDATVPYLTQRAATDPRVRIVRNPVNRGFAAANNAGIAAARGDVVILLNNDTVVPPGLVGRLVAHLRRDGEIGLLCPTTNFAGNEAKVDPGYSDLADLPAWATRRAIEHAGETFAIDVAAMYCVAARREVLDAVGALDENFGIGMFEDDDFSHRVRQAGFSVVCAEDAYVHHFGQGSFRKLSPAAYDAIWNRNKEYFEQKWGVTWKPHQVRIGATPSPSKIGE